MDRRASILGAVIGILIAGVAHGQGVPVYDNANFLQNFITAGEAVVQTTNQILELTPVEEVFTAVEIAEDLAILGDIVAEAELLYFDVQSLNAQIIVLFGLDNAPRTRTALDERIAAIKRLYYQSLLFATRTQTLIRTASRTIDHLTRLVNSIEALIGNHQANQTLVQVNSTMSKTLVVMETQQAAWQRTETLQRLTDLAVIESLNRINEDRLIDHPRY